MNLGIGGVTMKITPMAVRFAKLTLLARYHIAEEMGTQLQPGSSPDECAQRTLDTMWRGHDLAALTRLGKLIEEAEKLDCRC